MDSWAVFSVKQQCKDEHHAELIPLHGLELLNVNSIPTNYSSPIRPLVGGSPVGSVRSFKSRTGSRKSIPELPVKKYEPQFRPLDTQEEISTPDPIIDRMRLEREENQRKEAEEAELLKAITKRDREREEARKETIKRLKDKQYTYEYSGCVLLTRPPEIGHDETVQLTYNLDTKSNVVTKFNYVHRNSQFVVVAYQSANRKQRRFLKNLSEAEGLLETRNRRRRKNLSNIL